MKTIICLIITCLISTGAFMAALNMKTPYPAFIIAFMVWALFGWRANQQAKKASKKKLREQMFMNYMRHKQQR